MQNQEKISFSELLLWNNMTISDAAQLCGKSKRTIHTYQNQ